MAYFQNEQLLRFKGKYIMIVTQKADWIVRTLINFIGYYKFKPRQEDFSKNISDAVWWKYEIKKGILKK